MNKINQAVDCYCRRNGVKGFKKEYPDGYSKRGQKWYPTDEEESKCCQSIRSPSHAYPFSLFKHCFSIKHIANLFEVDVKELRKACKLRIKYMNEDALSIFKTTTPS